ncbi:MAG: hypothetical protein MSIBF_04260 [Candidatus Altiarchaeales archaeon IMC4]|nr:MAG: hypothetical protein MSIBF_04260 [Candidatus Altiarchaeales archaeon IMC4]
MDRDSSIYVRDMPETMKKAEEFVSGMDYEEFISDEKTSYAVVRCVEVMGEAAKHVPDPIRRKYPQMPRRDIAGMRDKIIHFYFGVNLERVWLVVKEDIPDLKPDLERILGDLQR